VRVYPTATVFPWSSDLKTDPFEKPSNALIAELITILGVNGFAWHEVEDQGPRARYLHPALAHSRGASRSETQWNWCESRSRRNKSACSTSRRVSPAPSRPEDVAEPYHSPNFKGIALIPLDQVRFLVENLLVFLSFFLLVSRFIPIEGSNSIRDARRHPPAAKKGELYRSAGWFWFASLRWPRSFSASAAPQLQSRSRSYGHSNETCTDCFCAGRASGKWLA
jgi:hypothetical protein